MTCKYCLPLSRFPFHSLDSFLCNTVSFAIQKLLSFMVPFVDFAFVVCVFGVILKEIAHFYGVRFKSLNHFESIFVNRVRDLSESTYPISQHY